MTIFDDWLSRKLSRPALTIRDARTVEETFSRVYGPRADFARIILTAEPSERFDFRSEVHWPLEPQKYDAAMVDGLLDELLATSLGSPLTKIRFVLREIRWHDVDSSPNAFYQAARMAVRKVIDRNIAYPWEQAEQGAAADRPRE